MPLTGRQARVVRLLVLSRQNVPRILPKQFAGGTRRPRDSGVTKHNYGIAASTGEAAVAPDKHACFAENGFACRVVSAFAASL